MRESHLFSRQRVGSAASQTARRPAHRLSGRRAFTLTELLIVVAIIAVLASLITAAAVNAMRNGRRARILLEIKQMAMAMEQLKSDYGAYPPNVYPGADTDLNMPAGEKQKNESDLRVFLSRAANRSNEQYNVSTLANVGLSPAEAAVFWLQGLSSDVQRPLSGSDLKVTTIDDGKGNTLNNVVTIDSFTPRYDFDRQRLRISRDGDGNVRWLPFRRIDSNSSTEFRILLYEYVAAGSEKPYLYFDTSRYTPYQLTKTFVTTGEFFFNDSADGSVVVPLKKLKANAPQNSNQRTVRQHLEYADQRKFQLLHPGLDDAWGNFTPFELIGSYSSNSKIPEDLLYFPDGPFTGDLADTLTSFFDGPLADAEEN